MVDKKKKKNCAVCGRPIRTGRLYCHIHRGTRPTEPVTTKTEMFMGYVLAFVGGFLFLVFCIWMLVEMVIEMVMNNLVLVGVMLLIPVATIIILWLFGVGKVHRSKFYGDEK